MRTTDNIKPFIVRREDAILDSLSTSKRRYIESWRQSVLTFMESGNICKVTVGDVTPEPPTSDVKKYSPTDNSKMTAVSPRHEMASPSLPAVKFSYSHVPEDVIRNSGSSKRDTFHSRVGTGTGTLATLPPSPNGHATQHATDLHRAYKQRTSGMRATSSNVVKKTTELPEVNLESKDLTRRSSKLAKEIYDKYNMKNKSHNFLSPGKPVQNGYEQYSMPWRNKTFLTLPLRFNNTDRTRTRISRERTNMSEYRSDVSDLDEELRIGQGWPEDRHW